MTSRSRTYWILGTIIGLGLLFRIAYFVELSHDGASFVPVQDAEYHDYWARGIAEGRWTLPEGYNNPEIRTTPYFRPPGYPWFLSGIYRLFGSRVTAAVAVQMLLGLLNVWLSFLVARRWVGEIPALVTAFFMSTYSTLMILESDLLDPTLHITVLLLLALLLEAIPRRQLSASFLAGVTAGAAILVRANTLLFIPVAAGWIAWSTRKGGRTAGSIGLFLVAVVLIVSPVTLRNYIAGDDLVLVSSNAGLMLNMGNSDSATGLTQTESLNNIQGGKYRSCFDYPYLVRHLGLRTGSEMSHSAASRYLANEAWAAIRRDPARFLRVTWQKARLFWSSIEIGHNRELYYQRMFSPVLKYLPRNFAAISALFAAGVLLLVGRKAFSSPMMSPESCGFGYLLLALVFTYFLSLVPFVFSSQYRIVLLPFLLMFAALALCQVARAAAQNRYREAGILGGAVLGVYLLLVIPVAGVVPSLSRWHYQKAYAYERAGMPDAARYEYETIIKIDPNHAWAHGALGMILARSGNLADARILLSRALEIEADFPKAQAHLAYVLALQGDSTAAVGLLQNLLDRDPFHLGARNGLAWILATAADSEVRDGEKAVHLARSACEATEYARAPFLDTLAAAQAASGDYASAIETASQALRITEGPSSDIQSRGIQERLQLYQAGKPFRMPTAPTPRGQRHR